MTSTSIEELDIYKIEEAKTKNSLFPYGLDEGNAFDQRRLASMTLTVLAKIHGIKGFNDAESFLSESRRIAAARIAAASERR